MNSIAPALEDYFMRSFVLLILSSILFLPATGLARERLLDADKSQDLKNLAYKVEVLCEN